MFRPVGRKYGTSQVRLLAHPNATRLFEEVQRRLPGVQSLRPDFSATSLQPRFPVGEAYYRVGDTLRGTTPILISTINPGWRTTSDLIHFLVAMDAVGRLPVNEVYAVLSHFPPSVQNLALVAKLLAGYQRDTKSPKGVHLWLTEYSGEGAFAGRETLSAESVGRSIIHGHSTFSLPWRSLPVSSSNEFAHTLFGSDPLFSPQFLLAFPDSIGSARALARTAFARDREPEQRVFPLRLKYKKSGSIRGVEGPTDLPGNHAAFYALEMDDPELILKVGRALKDAGIHSLILAMIHPTFLAVPDDTLERENPFDALVTTDSIEAPNPRESARIFSPDRTRVVSVAPMIVRAIEDCILEHKRG